MSYFLSDIAEFKKRNKVKDAILGRTASGRAFRIGSLVSAGGVGTTLLLNKNAVKKFLKKPTDTFLSKTNTIIDPVIKRYKTTGDDSFVLDGYRETHHKPRSFFGSGYKIKWGNVAKTAGVTGTAVAIPVGSAYAFGTKKERDRINRGITSSVRSAHKLSNDVRGWVNTLHRTSK